MCNVCLFCIRESWHYCQRDITRNYFFDGDINDTFFIMMLLILVGVVLIKYVRLVKKVFYIGILAKLRKNIEWNNFGNTLATENQSVKINYVNKVNYR